MIFITIWLDLLYAFSLSHNHFTTNLHSNMVRFIIKNDSRQEVKRRAIYIPIWLDLLFGVGVGVGVGGG